jgi:hypothetical protein
VATAWTPTFEGLPQVLGHPRLKGRPAPARTLAIGMTLPTLFRRRAVLCCILIEPGVATAWAPTLEALPQVLWQPRLKGRPALARTLAIGMTLPTLPERAVF